MALSQPRQEPESSSSSGESEDEDEALRDIDSPAVRMMRKSMMFQQDQKQIREDAIKQKRHGFRLPVSHLPFKLLLKQLRLIFHAVAAQQSACVCRAYQAQASPHVTLGTGYIAGAQLKLLCLV